MLECRTQGTQQSGKEHEGEGEYIYIGGRGDTGVAHLGGLDNHTGGEGKALMGSEDT